MAEINKDELLQVGVITTPHGVRGEVNVFPTTDDPARFKKLKSVIIEDKKGLRVAYIASVKFFKQMVILKFKDLDDRNEAELLRKCPLYVTRQDAVKLKKDEYFIADLIGLEVIDEDGVTRVGCITDVITTGANDVYEIKLDSEFLYQGNAPLEEKIYIPAIKESILSVDVEAGNMMIHIMPGIIG